MGHAGQVLGLEAGRDIGGQLGVPAFGKAGLQGAGFDGLDAGDGFHQHGLVLGPTGKLLIQAGAQKGHYRQAQAEVQRQTDQHNQGQRHTVEEHDGDKDHREHHIQQHCHGIARQEAANVLQLTHAGNAVPHPPRLKISQGQLHQMPKQLGPQLHIDPAGGVAEHIAAQGIQDGLKDYDHHQADDQHVQRSHTPVHQHLVHHHLEEQR